MSKEIWAMEPNYLVNYLERTRNVGVAEIKAAMESFYKKPDGAEHQNYTTDDDTAYIKIEGVLSKSGPSEIDRLYGFEGTGYKEICDSIKTAMGDASIKTIVFQINSPGGSADGVDEVYSMIQEACSKGLNVIAENHGLIASAAYWIASACSKIEAMSPMAETGSVGAVISAVDFSKMLDKMGVKRYSIVSKNAPKKAPDIATPEGREIIQERVDALERVFMSRVAEGRKMSVEDVRKKFGRGGLYVAHDPDSTKPDAIKVGMIDGIKNGRGLLGNYTKEESGMNASAKPKVEQKIIINDKKDGGKKTMNAFDTLLAEDSSAKALFDAKLEEKYQAGLIAGKAVINARIEKTVPFLGKTEYPAAIQELACKVLKGESEPAALEGAATFYDMMKAETAVKAAAVTEPVVEKKDVGTAADLVAKIEDKSQVVADAAGVDASLKHLQSLGLI
jgi:signal peptide peptidase SppA